MQHNLHKVLIFSNHHLSYPPPRIDDLANNNYYIVVSFQESDNFEKPKFPLESTVKYLFLNIN